MWSIVGLLLSSPLLIVMASYWERSIQAVHPPYPISIATDNDFLLSESSLSHTMWVAASVQCPWFSWNLDFAQEREKSQSDGCAMNALLQGNAPKWRVKGGRALACTWRSSLLGFLCSLGCRVRCLVALICHHHHHHHKIFSRRSDSTHIPSQTIHPYIHRDAQRQYPFSHKCKTFYSPI